MVAVVAPIAVDCSGCMEPVTVDVMAGTVTARVPSNGRRGSKHVPAHDVSNDDVTDDGHLAYWECPRPGCGYADSTYIDPDDAP